MKNKFTLGELSAATFILKNKEDAIKFFEIYERIGDFHEIKSPKERAVEFFNTFAVESYYEYGKKVTLPSTEPLQKEISHYHFWDDIKPIVKKHCLEEFYKLTKGETNE